MTRSDLRNALWAVLNGVLLVMTIVMLWQMPITNRQEWISGWILMVCSLVFFFCFRYRANQIGKDQ